ncbi:glycosyl transferase [Candidatus Poriferisodalis sp.]|uniref:glycosyl transferase n=1 Tax=Candidatus Poriferisodalis sp. TaxID=3101277 RepID=UPI003B02C4D2
MADFQQHESIATLHRLADRPIESLADELYDYSRRRPIALIIPALYSELQGPALGNIVDEIAKVAYIDEIIVGIDRADEAQFADARQFFARLPQRTRLLWNDGPRLRKIDEVLADRVLAPTEPGKGRNVWYCLGYFLASGRCENVALHDADILTYDRGLLARLLYPILHPTFGYSFSKGYYYRAGEGASARLNGRVVRLLVTPLLRALRATIGEHDYLRYLESFRYPLAGEFAMKLDMTRSIRIPSDWGLEIGVLSEVYRIYQGRRICQVDLCGRYDHKHQDLSLDDANAGLHKMSRDIAKAIYRKLAIDGTTLGTEIFRTVKAVYYRNALDLVSHYRNDATFNGFDFDLHAEETAVELFASAIMDAGDEFLNDPMGTPFIPNWSRVQSAIPDVLGQLYDAVELDNA